MILEGNGSTHEVALKNMKVGFVMPLKNKELGNNTSSTTTLNQGTKAKQLSINGLVPFDDKEKLVELVRLAEAVDSEGERVIYTINDETAEVGEIRQCTFTDNFKIDKDQKYNAWVVSFRLLQKNSVAEAKEARQTKAPTVTDTAAGQQVRAPTEQEESQVNETNGFIFNALKKLDDYLGQET